MSVSRRLAFGFACLLIWTFTSCSGSGSDEKGAVQVAFTDAATDEIDRFEVDVTRIELARANGDVAQALPVRTRINFTDLIGLAEIVNAATVPVGTYVSAAVTFDFSTATVHLTGATTDATLLDENGSPLIGSVKVNVELPPLGALIIAPTVTRVFTLDFDLNASATVDVAGNSVQLSPIIVANVDLAQPLPHRIRGPLTTVDVLTDSFVLAVRPFGVVSNFGQAEVVTDTDTFFEINGECFQGTAGMAEMDNLNALTAVVAVGEFDASRVFVADEVRAGSSVVGGALDAATGLVMERSGDTLTLRGARLDRAGGSVTFNEDVTVQLQPATTRVMRQLSLTPYTTDDISVGQRIVVFGTASDTTFVQSDWVRMERTGVLGTVISTAGTLDINASRIELRPVGDFDFTGTGSALATDADPANYEIDAGALDLSGLSPGDPVRVLGFVTPFGSADPDFEALSITDLSGRSLMAVAWSPSSTTQFSGITTSRLDLDLSESPILHHVDQAGVTTDLTGLPSPAVLPAASLGLYAIFDQGTVSLFLDFGDFVVSLEARLALGKEARRLVAVGDFNGTTGEMDVGGAAVVLSP